jgi:nucleoside-diphosphate-sugar epimerase
MQKPLAAVTGGTGFVGSHVVDALLAQGWSVRALVRRPESPGWLKGLPIETVRGDVRQADSLPALVRGAHAVIHVAGKTAARDLTDYRHCNAAGVGLVAGAVKEHAPGAHVVLVSSLAAAGPSRDGRPVTLATLPSPVSSYGISKLEGENELRAVPGLGFTILRPGAIYGPRETAIRDLFVLAARGFVPVLAGGRPRIQLVHVRDVVACVLASLERGPRGETFFVAHPEVLDYRGIAGILADLRKPRARLVPVPAPLIRATGLLVGSISFLRSGPPVFNREKAEEMLQPGWTCDVGDTQAALGEPLRTPFKDGAKDTWDWYLRQGWISPPGGPAS